MYTFTARKLLVECIPHLRVVALYLLVAKFSGVFGNIFPLLLMGLGIISLYYVGWKATLKKRSEKSLKYAYGQDDLAMECSCIFGLFLMFSFFFQDFQYRFPNSFVVEQDITYLNWLLFTVENIFESIFDVLSIFEIKISGIQPTDMMAKSAILLFRFTVNVVVILLLVRNWKNLKTYWQVHKKRRL